MILWDELYFEITLEGTRAELDKFVAFLNAGELDEFFEQSEDYVILDDKYDEAEDGESLEVVFTNDGSVKFNNTASHAPHIYYVTVNK